MALFNFNRNNTNTNAASTDSVQEVVLIVNDERIVVSAAEASGLTVAELFGRYAASSADVSRINRYVAQGRIVAGSSAAEVGTVYSGAISSESKG